MGNLVRDPELRYVESGGEQIEVCDFTLAVNRPGKNNEGVDYLPMTAWRGLARVIAEHKIKGDGMLVEGKLKSEHWEAEDGSKRSRVAIVAKNAQFLPRGNGNGAQRAADEIGDDDFDDDIPF